MLNYWFKVRVCDALWGQVQRTTARWGSLNELSLPFLQASSSSIRCSPKCGARAARFRHDSLQPSKLRTAQRYGSLGADPRDAVAAFSPSGRLCSCGSSFPATRWCRKPPATPENRLDGPALIENPFNASRSLNLSTFKARGRAAAAFGVDRPPPPP